MFAQSLSAEPFPFGSLEIKGGHAAQSLLQSSAITGEVHGLLFKSTIRQEYKNESQDALEVIYTFPLG